MSKLPSRRGSTSSTNEQALMPLLLASLGNPTPNFKTMAELSEGKHTQSSLEHKFRSWRKEGKALTDGQSAVTGPAKGANDDDEVDEEEDEEVARPAAHNTRVKKAAEEDDGGDLRTRDAREKSKKRGASTELDADSAAKKLPKKPKKGIARIVKKKKGPNNFVEEDDDEEPEAIPPVKFARSGRNKAPKVKQEDDDEEADD